MTTMRSDSLNEAFRRKGNKQCTMLAADTIGRATTRDLTPGGSGGMPYEDPFGTISVVVDQAVAVAIAGYTMSPRQVEQLRNEIKFVTLYALGEAFEQLRDGYNVNVPRDSGGLAIERRPGLSYDEVKRASVTKATMEFARKAAEEALLNFKPELYSEEWGAEDLPGFHHSDWAKSAVPTMRDLILGEKWEGMSY